jgi:hypothetical protein
MVLAKVCALSGALVVAMLGIIRAQTDGLDPEAVALVITRSPSSCWTCGAAAERSELARRASSFDRPDARQRSSHGCRARLQSANAREEFAITVDDQISQHDHTAGEFSITHTRLLRADRGIRSAVSGGVCGMPEARAIAMAKDQAREFDARLNTFGRRVSNEVRPE